MARISGTTDDQESGVSLAQPRHQPLGQDWRIHCQDNCRRVLHPKRAQRFEPSGVAEQHVVTIAVVLLDEVGIGFDRDVRLAMHRQHV